MKPFLSLCMIVKNEEQVLARCLDSVKSVADEIIIVDTGSTDQTKRVASQYTDFIYDFEWTNNFSDARNFAASKASGEWILALDADEFLDSENLEGFVVQLKKNTNSYEAYAVKIYNFLGDYGEQVLQHRHLRVYKNDANIYYFRSIHEQLEKKNGDLLVGDADLIIYHSGYLNKTFKEKNKHERNSPLIQKELEKGARAFDYFNLGNEYFSVNKINEALEAYKTAYSKKEQFNLSWVSIDLLQIVNCLIRLKRFYDALNVIQDAEEIWSTTVDFKCLKANIYFLQNRDEDLIHEMKDLLANADRYNHSILNVNFKDHHPHFLLGNAYSRKKDYKNAVTHYVMALNYNKAHIQTITNLMHILVKQSSDEEILAFIDKCRLTEDKKTLIHLIRVFLSLGRTNLSISLLKLLEDNSLAKKGLLMKYYLASEQLNLSHSLLKETAISDLNYIMNNGYFDVYDILILGLLVNDYEILYRLEKNAVADQDKNFINFIIGNTVGTVTESYYMIFLERCIQLRQFELFEKIINRRYQGKMSSSIDLSVGHLLYRHEFRELAIDFYNIAGIDNLDNQAFINLINEFLRKNELEDALEFGYLALKQGYTDFRIFEDVIGILETNGNTKDMNDFTELALEYYPDSKWLKELKNIEHIQKQQGIIKSTTSINTNIKISLIIPAYNAEKYIRETIESALAQTVKDKEIIIVNDGSSDDTLSIIKEYSNYPIVRVFDNGVNRGGNYTYNFGLMQSKGEFVTFLDADDIYLPNYCEKVINEIEQNQADLGFANLFVIEDYQKLDTTLYGNPRDVRFQNIFGGPNNPFPDRRSLRKMILQGVHISPRSIYKRALFNLFGMEDSRLKIAHDWLRHIKFIINGAKCVYVNEPLGYYRVHSEGNSQRNPIDNLIDNIKVMEIVHKEYRHLLTDDEHAIVNNLRKKIRTDLFAYLASSEMSNEEIINYLISNHMNV